MGISRGFDFLGYRFSSDIPAGLVGVVVQTIECCVERMNRLYERGADAVRIDEYIRRWQMWVRNGMSADRGGWTWLSALAAGHEKPTRNGTEPMVRLASSDYTALRWRLHPVLIARRPNRDQMMMVAGSGTVAGAYVYWT